MESYLVILVDGNRDVDMEYEADSVDAALGAYASYLPYLTDDGRLAIIDTSGAQDRMVSPAALYRRRYFAADQSVDAADSLLRGAVDDVESSYHTLCGGEYLYR